MSKAITRMLAVGAAVALGLGLAACSGGGDPGAKDGGQKELKPFSFQLNQPPNGSNAPFAAAVEEGFYADEGLDVDIVPGVGSSQTAQMVAAGQADIGFADSASTTALIAKDAPLVVVATIYQSNPNEVIALKDSGISSIADLKGKKVGTPVPSSQASMLPLFLGSNDLTEKDVELVNLAPTSLVQSLLGGQVDAILGSTDTYEVQLKNEGADDLFTAMFADNGVATVSTSIFASRDYLESNPDDVKGFVKASLKGWSFAADDPKAAVDDLDGLWGPKASKTSLDELQAVFDGDLLCAGGAKYLGRSEPEQWATTQDLLASVDLLPEGVDPESYYTYDYLPDESDLRACPLS